MTKPALIQSIFNYSSDFSLEIEYRKRFLTLLKDEDCFFRSRLAGHLTASCWVLAPSGNEVLLIHHKKLDKWLQPGGHADGDTDLLNVAKKELSEETGLVHYSVNEKIFDLDIHVIPQRKDVPEHFHYDVRFLFQASHPNEIQKNHESMELRWVGLNKVEVLCDGEESIMRMVRKLEL